MNSRESQNGLQCSQFEALLAEALDGALAGEAQQAFETHRLNCELCGPLFAETREGMLLLRELPEVEPPQNLVHNILARTSLAEAKEQAAQQGAPAGWLERLRQKMPAPFAGILTPRFVTSFCMAFFSLSLTLSIAGVRVTDLARMAAHPGTLRKSVVLEYTQLEARVQRYYDNMRIVYEVESRVRGLKRNTAPAPENNRNNRQEQNWNSEPDNNGRPQNRENYSQERDDNAPQQAQSRFAGNADRIVALFTTRDEGAQI